MNTLLKTAIASIGLAALSAGSASANFLDGLEGTWSGSGKAYLKGLGNVGASCKMSGNGNADSLSMNGRCGVLLFKVGLGLKLMDAGNGRYTGVYTGSRTGPAALSGTLDGNKLTMSITWGGVVNGDRNATMILTKTGPGSFSQTVYDKVGGKKRRTSRFNFKKL